MSGLYGALGLLLALRQRDVSGEGQEIDIALYEPVFRVLDELAPAFAKVGTVRGREGLGTLNACPHGHFECGDGGWVAIACTSDKMWERLAAAMGRPELAASHPRSADRIAARADIDGAVTSWTKARPRAEVIERCVAGEVPCGPVNTIADIFADPHFKARGNLAEIAGAIVPNVVPTLSRTPGRVERLGPPLGADTEIVLRDRLGLSDAEIAALRRDGVV
jgi:crotonobetainyl-CoA:carnitine CoA-transferase CaiB-like acyl-CoA transferase